MGTREDDPSFSRFWVVVFFHQKHHQHRASRPDKHTPPFSIMAASTSSSSSQSKQTKTIEQLRAERLRRETAEKQKIAAVMARSRGEKVEAAEDVVSDVDRDRSRGYNSRYNPAFVKPSSHYRR